MKKKQWLKAIERFCLLTLPVFILLTPQLAAAKTINLTFSDHNPPSNAAAQSIAAYAKHIEDHSNGQVQIKVLFNADGDLRKGNFSL